MKPFHYGIVFTSKMSLQKICVEIVVSTVSIRTNHGSQEWPQQAKRLMAAGPQIKSGEKMLSTDIPHPQN